MQELKTDKWDEDGTDDDYPNNFYNFFMEKILYNIRYLGHGGSVILVPHDIESDDPRLRDRILLKYDVDYDYAWNCLVRSLVNYRRYYDLYFPLRSGDKKLTSDAFEEFDLLSHKRDQIDEEMQDIAKNIASLASVDGALVNKFTIQGPGFWWRNCCRLHNPHICNRSVGV